MRATTLCRLAACAAASMMAISGCTPGGHVRSAERAPAPNRAAENYAAMGVAAMQQRNGVLAIAMAEHAVASAPQDARYRSQLGQSYLMAGRFASAIDAFHDAATLAPEDGRVLLGMALADGALDRTVAARASVEAARGRMPDADRGLALALAGDADAAIPILEAAARVPGATPKTRQNLALAYALAGRWDVARVTAAQDLSSADLEMRLAKWAKLAAPQPRIDRIAAFLGVTPATMDGGMPVQLALAATMPEPAGPVAVAAADPVPATPAETPVESPVETVAMTTAPAPEAVVPAYVAPVARLRPALLLRTADRAGAEPRRRWAVQLGAFASGQSIETAWARIRRTVRPVAGMVALTSVVRTEGKLFQRLAVGGIDSRGEAVALCERVRAAHGVCFVRGVGDEAPMRMAGDPRAVRIAAR